MWLDDWCAYKVVVKYKLKKFSTLHLGIRLKVSVYLGLNKCIVKWSEKMNTISQLSTSV